jgi:hypothetical protein
MESSTLIQFEQGSQDYILIAFLGMKCLRAALHRTAFPSPYLEVGGVLETQKFPGFTWVNIPEKQQEK